MNPIAYQAAQACDARALQDAVRKGIKDINATNSKGYTCLHLTCARGSIECAGILLKEGRANVNAATQPSYETPLHVAAQNGHSSVVSLLLQYQPSLNDLDTRNSTPLHNAAAAGFYDIVKLLLTQGASMHIRDYKNRTPMQLAEQYKQAKVVALLAANGGASDGPATHGVPSGRGGRAIAPDSGRAPLQAAPNGVNVPSASAEIYGTAGYNYPDQAGKENASNQDHVLEEEPTRDPSEVLEEELEKIVGLGKVKEMLRSLCKQVAVDQRRAQYGFKPQHNLNMLFLGNPGTGKTCMARIVAKMMKELGVLKSGQLVEVTRKDLVAEYAGQSAARTAEKIKEALGGVLFIDEAYSLKHEGSHDGFGQECVNTLVAEMENKRDELVVVMAGYSKEMSSFIASNSGLASRFPIVMEFANYDWEEMAQIFDVMVRERNLQLQDTMEHERICQLLQQNLPKSTAAKGNGRAVRNFLEAVLREQTNRLADSGTQDKDELLTITEADFAKLTPEKTITELDEVMAQLDAVVGVTEVKQFLRSMRAQITITQEKKALGIPVDNGFGSMHMIFKGNPGTGKTMMARLVGKMLKALGILSQGQLIEATRADLVGEHLGETAQKTMKLVDRALGGVLFIDEAYSLINDTKDSYGKEAVETLLKMIEDWRSELVIILAGHSSEMDLLIAKNPGLRSRFPLHLTFPDYSSAELVAIACKMLEQMNMQMSREALQVVAELCKQQSVTAISCSGAGNARWVRNLLEAACLRQAERLCLHHSRSRDDLVTLHASDFDASRRVPPPPSGPPAQMMVGMEQHQVPARYEARRYQENPHYDYPPRELHRFDGPGSPDHVDFNNARILRA